MRPYRKLPWGLLTFILWTVGLGAAHSQDNPLRLWYQHPAKAWTEALPIGNGRLGAMVFGGIAEEHLQFNEDTLWTGHPHEYQHEGAAKALPEIRQLLFDGKQQEAEELAGKEFMSEPLHQKAYQPFGDLHIQFPNHQGATNYQRELDLSSAIAKVSYQIKGVTYERQFFASYPDQVLVCRLSSSHPGRVNFTVSQDSPHASARRLLRNKDQLALAGEVESGGLKFESRVRVITEGGRVSVCADSITVENADSAVILLAAATSFKNYKDISADPAGRCDAVLNKLAHKDFETLLQAHLVDYQKLFGRVSLDLGDSAAAKLPTNERLKGLPDDPDPQLAALYFQFGRYLLIASSRPGSQPANLQGIWNDQMRPPWDSKWTVNINTEMNYWPAEVCNLSECHEPLFDLIGDCAVTGRKTAQAHYGLQGWVLHHNTDLWRGTAPINASNHGIWPTGGAWLCHHLWDHYLYTGDKAFLRNRAYPIMKEAALFFADYLVKDPKTGRLISGPSNSPEQGGLVMGPTMDHQIIRDLFANTTAAAELLGVDKVLAARLTKLREEIAPNQIGQYHQLQEWMEDKDDPKNTHRHCSHLWAVFPGWEITPLGTPDLSEAAKQSLIFRGDSGTGWSKAWKIALWARFLDGDHARKLLGEALAKNTYPNLFDAHPPFQIDGNFGGTAAIAEMLVQSHLVEVRGEKRLVRVLDLLPALPTAWSEGSVKGLRARDGFEIDMTWTKGKLMSLEVRSLLGRPCQIRTGDKAIEISTIAGNFYAFNSELKPL